METITAGSIESLLVDILDRTKQLVVLPGTTQFEVRNEDGTIRQSLRNATVSGMEATCLINTTVSSAPSAGVWPNAYYDIYLVFPYAPETPRKGPLRFKVQS